MAQRTPTRSNSKFKLSDIVGEGQEFLPSEVPTLGAVIRKGILIQQNNLHNNISRHNYTISDLSRDLAELILDQWKKSNIEFQPPLTKHKNTIAFDIKKKWRTLTLMASEKATQKDRTEIMSKLNKVYNIVLCQCKIVLCTDSTSNCEGCEDGVHIFCNCQNGAKIPRKDLKWFYYQKLKVGEKSIFQMGCNDHPETNRKIKAMKRKLSELAQAAKAQDITEEQIEFVSSSESSKGSNGSVDQHNQPSRITRNYKLKVTNVVEASIRFGVSLRATSSIVCGLLQDLVDANYLTEEERVFLTCDTNKIMRAKYNCMDSVREFEESRVLDDDIQGIFFDGRKDKTKLLTHNNETGNYHSSVIEEEHYTMTQEPQGKYLHHFSPIDYADPSKPAKFDKPAKRIAAGVFDWINTHGARESVQVIGGDTTNTMTGWDGGALTHLEKKLGHRCLWSMCMIHLNELPLRHLIKKLDGETCSGNKFKGEIGKLLPKVNELPINYTFKALPDGEDLIHLPEEIVQTLSTDQYNCYHLVKAIKSGYLSKELGNRKGGPISHSRWLTTGQALLLLWTRDHKLQGETLRKLELIVKFVIQSYFKLYFDIKVKNSLIDAPKHILTAVKIFRTQPTEVQEAIKDTIARGAYHAHSENLILSLLASNIEEDRIFAIKKILEIRGPFHKGDALLRQRITPAINFEATSLSNLILWDKESFEPIFTHKMHSDTIKSFHEFPLNVPYFPIHSQSTERAVQHVSKASMAVFGQDKRDGFVKGMLAHREKYPVIGSKKTLI